MEPGGHDCDRVDEDDDGFILVCQCGWRSDSRRSAAAVGDEWDRHRTTTA